MATAWRYTQKDGFGWLHAGWMNEKFPLCGEKVIKPADFFFPGKMAAAVSGLPEALHPRRRWLLIGGGTATQMEPGVLMMHGRTATSEIQIDSVHPLIRGAHALMHNGILDGVTPYEMHRELEVDSESLLLCHEHSDDPVVDISGLEGYGAWIHVTPFKITVVRDNVADLHIAWSAMKVTYVIATEDQHVRDICSCWNETVSPVPVDNHTWLTFTGTKKEDVSAEEWPGFEVAEATTPEGATPAGTTKSSTLTTAWK